MDHETQREHARRDSYTLTLIGVFLMAMAALVFVAMLSEPSVPGRVVGIGVGLVLLIIGAVFAGIGRRIRRRADGGGPHAAAQANRE